MLHAHEVPLAQAGTLRRLVRENCPPQEHDRYGIVYTFGDLRYRLVKPWRGHTPEVVGEVTTPGLHEPLTVQQLAEAGMTPEMFTAWYQGVLERHSVFNGPYDFMQPDVYLATVALEAED